jgi:arylsulfatase
MDQNIGRVINKLKASNKLENTLIIFLVDNGSCPFYANKIKDIQPGPANSYWSLRATWANLGSTPYRQFKQSGYEGGSRAPFIAHWPKVIKPNSITEQPGHVVDLAPTFLEILDIDYPDSIQGYTSLPLDGSSLFPIFKGEKRKEPTYFISGLDKFRMFRSGDYKIVRMNGGNWELYNIKKDPSELINLAILHPEILQKIADKYSKIAPRLNSATSSLKK